MNETLFLLLLLWAAVLLPAAIRSARKASPHATVGGFERAMEVLGNDRQLPGRHVFVPANADRIVDREVATVSPRSTASVHHEDPRIARRRSLFVRLLVMNLLSIAVAVAFGGWLWVLAAVLTGATAVTVVVLRRLKLQRDLARQVVREIDLREDLVGPDDPTAIDEPVAVGDDAWAGSGTIRLRRWDA